MFGALTHEMVEIMRGVSHGLGVFAVLCGLMAASGVEARAQSSGTTKADTTKKTQPKPTTTTAPSKPPAKPPAQAPAKPTTTTTKPATTKTTAPTGTTAKPAPSGPSTRAGGATGGTAPRASSAGAARKATAEAYSTVGVYAGGATAGLGFGAGPSGGLVWRRKSTQLPLALRADASVSRFTQQPVTASGAALADASLLHAGASLGLEWVFARGHTARPYLTASGGVFRFQASGPAGTNSSHPNAVYASTTDVALLAGAGVRLGQRLFLEARLVTVGDFQSIPFVLGVHF